MLYADITFQRYNFNLSVNLKLTPGSITALIGESGSGKTSLFRLLAGLESPRSGEIYTDDICWFDAEKKINLAVQQRKVGMVFQDYALFEHLTVYDNIAYGVVSAKAKTEVNRVVDGWLKKINLVHKSTAYPQELSGGEKQRVALARALAPEPEILLLDEPFSALDIAIRHDLRRELQGLINDMQIPVFIATHDLFEARIIADTVYVMSTGNIIRHGATSNVFKDPQTIQAAKALGWQNIVSAAVFGDSLSRSLSENLPRNVTGNLSAKNAVVGIPISAISTEPSCSHEPCDNENYYSYALTVTVNYVADMGEYYLVESSLENNSRLVFHVASHKNLIVGQKLHIYINLSHIISLVEVSA